MTLRDILDAHQLNHPVCAYGTDKQVVHPYIEHFYESAFAPYHYRPTRLLEIGVYSGASIHLWHEYFQQGQIVGMDIEDRVLPQHRNLSRAEYVFRDAYHPGIFSSDTRFDVIIDDGPHTFESQIWALEFYLPHLAPGGFFIIEDVQNLYYAQVFRKLVPGRYRSETINLSDKGTGHMDVLFVVRG
jgi:cephalosporin hydroxylase